MPGSTVKCCPEMGQMESSAAVTTLKHRSMLYHPFTECIRAITDFRAADETASESKRETSVYYCIKLEMRTLRQGI